EAVDHLVVAAPEVLHEIEPAVVVDVAEVGDHAEARAVDAGLFADVRERAVAVVVKELRAAEGAAEKEVRVAVVVVIAPGRAHGGSPASSVTSVNAPLPLLRNSRWRLLR